MNFRESLQNLIERIETKQPLCFVRYGDGEVSIMNGYPISRASQACMIDKWSFDGGKTKLGTHLETILKNNDPNWIFGIPCQCCNLVCKNYLLNNLAVGSDQVTFANIFVNANYQHFIRWIYNLEESVVVVANKRGDRLDNFPFKVKKYFSIEDGCVDFYEKHSDTFLANLKEQLSDINDSLFFISAGPLSEVIVHELWKLNKTNRLIDVGSSLDYFIHGSPTRPYMNSSSCYSKQECIL